MSPPQDELARLDAMGQAALVRKGEVTALELVDAAIARIEQLNPRLNAVVTPMFEEARRRAAEPLPAGPLAGAPMVLKDLVAEYAGVRFTEGSRFLQDYVSPIDTTLVARYKAAGLMVVGKSNTPEFGSLPTTEPELFGPTHNPWHLEHSPGGSSGGSAAAVAAGLVPIGHANDGGGSIRIPASACGLVGLKPTRGRNPLGPYYGDATGLVHEHVVTRSVRDTAAVLDATAGPDVGAPYFAPPPARPFLQEVGAAPGRLRIAFSTAPLGGSPVDAQCVAAVRDTAQLCESLGHTVEEAMPATRIEEIEAKFTVLWMAFVAWAIKDWERRIGRQAAPTDFERLNWIMHQRDAQRQPAHYLLAVQDLQVLARDVGAFFQSYDVWLTPTMARPPSPLGYFAHDKAHPRQSTERQREFACFAMIGNITGQPAISLPLAWSAEGLPIGLQFFGRYADEATLLRLAAQLEQARPWADRRPAMSA